MIIYRYFAKEVLLTMVTVAGFVLVIAMGWRFSGYLGEAARGTLTSDILFLIMAYRLPGFLELIVPVSFFLAIMLTYGRLYVDSEMVVLQACGMSQRKLVWITLVMAILVTTLTASISLWLKPAGEAQVERLFESQRNLTEFDTLAAGRFQTLRSGKRVTYTEELAGEGELHKVFINEYKESNYYGPKDVITVMSASGKHQVDPESGDRFLVLKDGMRYSGEPGSRDFQIIEYEEYGQLIEKDNPKKRARRRTAIPTRELLRDRSVTNMSELHWRISMILLVPVIAIMAVPLSRVNPRQGRFTRLIPGMIFCFIYVICLSAARAALEKEQIPIEYGLWWVHLIFMLLVFAVFYLETLTRPLVRMLDRIGAP